MLKIVTKGNGPRDHIYTVISVLKRWHYNPLQLNQNPYSTPHKQSTFISLEFLCDCFIENGKVARVVPSENDPAIIYDSEGDVYPADIMALAVLLNSD